MGVGERENMVARPFRLAILGGGAVTNDLYLPALRLVPDIQAVVVADACVAAEPLLRANGFMGRFVAAHFDDFLAELSVSDADAVVVSLPNAFHESAALIALGRGFPVLVEKPVAMTKSGCFRISAASRKSGKVAAAGMVRRLLPSVVALREALSRKLIGPIRSVHIEDGSDFTWSSNSGAFFRPENGGVLADMGVHYLDLVHHLVGPLEPLSYFDDWQGGCEANVVFRLRARNGIPVEIRLSRNRSLRNRVVFAGEKGDLVLIKENFAACSWQPAGRDSLRGELTATRPFVDSDWPTTDFASCFAQQFHSFASCVRGYASVLVPIEDASQTIGLIEWAYSQRAQCCRGSATADNHERPRLPGGAVVVTGATGFIGGQLVERLNLTGCKRIVTPVRNYRTCVQIARFPVEMHRIDLLDRESIRETLQGARFVFHLAYGREGPHTSRITVNGTINVVEAAIATGAECVVVLSTAYVFGRPAGPGFVDETWPYSPVGGEYGRSKAAMERWCLKRAAASRKTRIVILNPTCVYGPWGKTYTMLPVKLAQAGQFCWIVGGEGIANYTYVENLIDAMFLAATSPEAHGKRFIINDGSCTWREFLEPLIGPNGQDLPSYNPQELRRLANAAPPGRWRDLVSVTLRNPEFRQVARKIPLIAAAKEWVPQVLRHHQPGPKHRRRQVANGKEKIHVFPPEWLADLFAPVPTRFSSEQARHVLHWQPGIALTEGQRRTISFLKEIGLRANEAP